MKTVKNIEDVLPTHTIESDMIKRVNLAKQEWNSIQSSINITTKSNVNIAEYNDIKASSKISKEKAIINLKKKLRYLGIIKY